MIWFIISVVVLLFIFMAIVWYDDSSGFWRGKTVKILTARVGTQRFDVPEELTQIRDVIEAWCEKHVGQSLEITCQKDFGMIELWDDRAIQIIPNTGERADGW